VIPFDADKLRGLMGADGLDLLLACSRHNVRYLTGGYYYHFHARAARMAQTRYLPFVGVPRASIAEAFYVCRPEERGQIQSEGVWIGQLVDAVRGTVPAAESAVRTIRERGLARGSIGVEWPFLPADAFGALHEGLPEARFVDATAVLDELRAVKTPAELSLLRRVYEQVAEAIQAAFAAGAPGITTAEMARAVEREITQRGAEFLYALVCAGPGRLRAPSGARWEQGRVLHIDAGGAVRDYLADICRMGCLGRPSPLAQELHAACLDVQGRVRRLVRAGLPCGDLLREGERAIGAHRDLGAGKFLAHGIGMVSHEQPDIGPASTRPLEAGMVLSVESEFIHPEVGHVKIEDAMAVTEAGCEGLGDLGRDWHVLAA